MTPAARPIGHQIVRLPEAVSTNSLVLDSPEYLGNHGLVVIAEHQTGGRGRVGSTWASLPGRQLQFSLVLHPPLPREQVPLLSLLAGLAVGNCLARELALRPLLKWPNDVFLGARKVCGILLEMKMQGGAPRVVVGIGLNCNGAPEDFPPDLRESLTTLAHETGRAVDMPALFVALLARQQEVYDRLLAGQQTTLLEEWSKMAALEGRALIYPTPGGPRQGKALGLTEEGHLLIETAAGATHVHHSGELEWTG